MPCFAKKNSLDVRSRRKTTSDKDQIAPKPVCPRGFRYHGLFGLSIAAQHLIFDERYTPSSLKDIYTNLNGVLESNLIYNMHENRHARARLLLLSKSLKLQCTYGRLKLQNIKSGNNAQKIHNLVMNYKDMQRLYLRMPIHLVVENVNQRTFTMRKERDRLENRLNQLKRKYKELLLERSHAHNRLTYQDSQVLTEEINNRVLLKKIENSQVRLNAIRIINVTYKKMQQVLLHDEIFYDHILNSLDEDIEEQNAFIKHILHLGMPVIAKYRELNKELFQLEAESREALKSKINILKSLEKPKVLEQQEVKFKEILTANPRRYIRLTDNMVILKKELESIEGTIKNLKKTVLASQAKEIYPRLKTQAENNQSLHRDAVHGIQSRDMLMTKMKCSTLLSDVLVDNLSSEEINRLERIAELKKTLKEEQRIENEHCEYMKNRANAYVAMRISLWNLYNILSNIDPLNPRVQRVYKSSALKLPLLKFDLFEMIAIPPQPFAENINLIMDVVKRRLYNLIKRFKPTMMDSIHASRKKYHTDFLAGTYNRSAVHSNDMTDDLLMGKSMAIILNRKQIKAQSAKIVEGASKRDTI